MTYLEEHHPEFVLGLFVLVALIQIEEACADA
jgi:hypothetical protein